MKKLFTLIGIIALCPLLSYGQCSGTATTTESRCASTGSITINMGTPPSSGTYSYSLTSGPVTASFQNSNVFSNIPAGTYTVNVVNSSINCNINITATVAGTYANPSVLNATTTNIFCPNASTGALEAIQPTGGRTPWTYSIVAGPVTRPLQSSRLFSNLPVGEYTMNALDSCGFLRTSKFTIGYDTSYIDFGAGIGFANINCNDLGLFLPQMNWVNTAFNNRPVNVKWVVPSGDTILSNGNNFENMPTPMDTLLGYQNVFGDYKVIVTDTCGREYVFTSNRYTLNVGPQLNDFNCDSFTTQFRFPYTVGNVNVHWEIFKCSDNTLYTESFNLGGAIDMSAPFPKSLEYGVCYYATATTSCGKVYNIPNFTYNNTPLNGFILQGPGCIVPGTGSITASANAEAAYPVDFKIIAGPERIGETVTIYYHGGAVGIRNLQLGTYVIETKDSCGRIDLDTILLDIPLIINKSYTVTPNCSGGADVHMEVESNYYMPGWWPPSTRINATFPSYTLVNESISGTASATTFTTWKADLFNINPSNDTLLLRLVSNNDSYLCEVWDTLHIPPYQLPVITDAKGLVCANGIGTVNVTLTGGKAPFNYRIKPSSSSTWSSFQATTVFSGLTPGMYDIEVQDQCPNGYVQNLEMLPFEASPIISSPPCATENDNIQLSVLHTYPNVTYEWFKNNSLVHTGNTLNLTAVDNSDTGRYVLRQTLNGACVDADTFNLQFCFALPIHLEHFTVEAKNNCDYNAQWKINKNDYYKAYEIEQSTDAIRFTSVKSIQKLANQFNETFSSSLSSEKIYFRLKLIEQSGQISYSNVIGINNNCNAIKNLEVYPSPVHDKLTVKGSNGAKIRVINQLGQIVFETIMENDTQIIDVQHLAIGLYHIEQSLNGQKTSSKFTKK